MEGKYQDWFDGFKTIISEQIGVKAYKNVMKDCSKCKSIPNDPEMASCVKEVMEHFDTVVDEKEKRKKIMEMMGYYCFQNNFLNRALQVKDQSKGIEEIIKNLNQIIGDDDYFKLEGNLIEARFNQCYCHVGVQATKEPIPKTYCYCSLGWLKDLFKVLLERNVKVDMIETIVSGGNICHFVIHLD
jgi:hypothetical protein